jgi:cytochrome c-type biogenesis protein CcmH
MKALFFFIFFSVSAFALSPENHLTNETQEQRAMKLFLQVRCLVCEGQVIESSETEFSFEMRKLIRKKISEGKSDEKIKEELVQEFGEDILLEPQYKNRSGLLLLILPIIFAITGAVFLMRTRSSINRLK